MGLRFVGDNKIYRLCDQPTFLQELKDNIQTAITSISRLVPHCVPRNIFSRCMVCLETGGKQFEIPL
jgi:hypothetical protein